MPELKPCPFCGAQPTFDLSDVDEYGQAWDRLACPSCYAYVERALNKDGTGSDVVERWNKRTAIRDLEQQKARADRLAALLREIANAGVFITCDTSRRLMARIEVELGES